MKIHCSSLPALMTKPRNKGEILSETAKAMLREMWIKEKYGREKFDRINKYTNKGIMVESDSLDLVSKYLSQPLFKNNKELSNDYITGTPDTYQDSFVMDVKSSWDIWTYAEVDESKARKQYYYQLVGYAILTGKLSMKLVYSLTNTPEMIITDELYKLSFKIGEDEETQNNARRNYIYDDIPLKERVKIYNFDLTAEELQEEQLLIEAKVVEGNNYIRSLSLEKEKI